MHGRNGDVCGNTVEVKFSGGAKLANKLCREGPQMSKENSHEVSYLYFNASTTVKTR